MATSRLDTARTRLNYPRPGIGPLQCRRPHPQSSTIAHIQVVEVYPVRRVFIASKTRRQRAPLPACGAAHAAGRQLGLCPANRFTPLPEADAASRPDLQGPLPLELF